jgi:hypothetical protein
VTVTKEGSTLKIGLDGKRRRFQKVNMKVAVAMPNLEGLSAGGVSKVTLAGFKSARDCKLRASGACHVKGELQARNLDLQATGVSHISLTGSARTARLSATGASHLALAGFSLRSADVVLTGACHAKIQVKRDLDYNLSGASHLRYVGDPKVGKKRVTGVSKASSQPR